MRYFLLFVIALSAGCTDRSLEPMKYDKFGHPGSAPPLPRPKKPDSEDKTTDLVDANRNTTI